MVATFRIMIISWLIIAWAILGVSVYLVANGWELVQKEEYRK